MKLNIQISGNGTKSEIIDSLKKLISSVENSENDIEKYAETGLTSCFEDTALSAKFKEFEPVKDETEDEEDGLVDAAIDEIKNDIKNGDTTAIEGMLRLVPRRILIDYLPEEKWGEFNK